MEINKLYQIIKESTDQIEKSKQGSLVISNCKGNSQFYQYMPDNSRRYLSLKDRETIKELAQKLYNTKVLKEAKNQIKALEKSKKLLHPDFLISVYEELPEAIKEYVIPYELPDREFTQQWIRQTYITKADKTKEFFYVTDRGEKVRSKSELIIANKLASYNIPYKYERKTILPNKTVFFPDFTLLNISNRTDVIYEHFGMMNNNEYANAAINKIKLLRKNGYIENKNLIYTMETSTQVFDTKDLETVLINAGFDIVPSLNKY